MHFIGSNLYHYQLGEGCESAARTTFKHLLRPPSDPNLYSVRDPNPLIYLGRSDRGGFHSFGMDFNTGHRSYGDTWRAHRKMFHRGFNSAIIHEYHGSVTQRTRTLLESLLQCPEKFENHLKM